MSPVSVRRRGPGSEVGGEGTGTALLDDTETASATGGRSTPLAEHADADGDGVAEERTRADRRRRRLVLVGLTAVLTLPLLVALVALHSPRWYPILDLAMTELRIRDVGTRHTPLIGLPGRIGVLGTPTHGSHPGPLSFWLLAPTYRIFGASAWATEVATVVLHAAAVATALWLAGRRGGIRLMLGVAVVLATLTRSYGADVLTQPWNPYMPVLWWFVLLLAVWSVLSADVKALPVAVFAASVCAQTHAPYLGMVAGLAGVTAMGLGAQYRRADAASRRRVRGWVLASLALAGLLWVSLAIDQVTSQPGNLSNLVDYFRHPPEAPVGLHRGVTMVLLHLDVWRLFTGQGADAGSLAEASRAPTGSVVPGLTVLVVWVAAVAAAWRLRHGLLLWLHVVVAAGLALAVVSISRIFGPLWYYLMLWVWGITSLLVLATVWSVAALVADRSDPRRRSPMARASALALVAVMGVSSAVFAIDASGVEQPAPELSDTMAALMPRVLDVLKDGSVPGRGRDERYLVGWSDAINIGAQGIALVNELERAGYDVGVIRPWSTQVARHRRRDPSDATSAVVIATGANVARWQAEPDATEIAYVDLRSPAERAEFARVRKAVIFDLRATGLDDLVPRVDDNLFAAAIDPRLSKAAQDGMTKLLDLGGPTAVFIGPPTLPI